MTNVTQINVRVFTVSGDDTGTSDPVYLGLGGREFRLVEPREPWHEFPRFYVPLGI